MSRQNLDTLNVRHLNFTDSTIYRRGWPVYLITEDLSGNVNACFDTVGIGAAACPPTQPLDVSGNARFRADILDSNNTIGIANQVLTTTATGVQWQTMAGTAGTNYWKQGLLPMRDLSYNGGGGSTVGIGMDFNDLIKTIELPTDHPAGLEDNVKFDLSGNMVVSNRTTGAVKDRALLDLSGNLHLKGVIYDSSDNYTRLEDISGSPGFVLSSTGTGVSWIDTHGLGSVWYIETDAGCPTTNIYYPCGSVGIGPDNVHPAEYGFTLDLCGNMLIHGDNAKLDMSCNPILHVKDISFCSGGTLDLSCSKIQDVSGIFFCDGSSFEHVAAGFVAGSSATRWSAPTDLCLEVSATHGVQLGTDTGGKFIIDEHGNMGIGEANFPFGGYSTDYILDISGSVVIHGDGASDADLDMSCNHIKNVTRLSFCTGGGGLDLSCCLVTDASNILFCDGSAILPAGGSLDLSASVVKCVGDFDMSCNQIFDVSKIAFCEGGELDLSCCPVTDASNILFCDGSAILPAGGSLDLSASVVKCVGDLDMSCNQIFDVSKISFCTDGSGIDMSCNPIRDVSGIFFCDGSYLIHGASLDISGDGICLQVPGNPNALNIGTGSSGGEVGVGVAPTSGINFVVGDDTPMAGIINMNTDLSNPVVFGASTPHGVTFIADNTSKMVIEPGGNVGIGLNNPEAKLDISGGTVLIQGTDAQLDMSCNSIVDVSNISFCPGGSLDLSCNSITDASNILFCDGSAILPAGGSLDLSASVVKCVGNLDMSCNQIFDVSKISFCTDGSGIDMSCNPIRDVSGIFFCDGSALFTGSSLDISASSIQFDVTDASAAVLIGGGGRAYGPVGFGANTSTMLDVSGSARFRGPGSSGGQFGTVDISGGEITLHNRDNTPVGCAIHGYEGGGVLRKVFSLGMLDADQLGAAAGILKLYDSYNPDLGVTVNLSGRDGSNCWINTGGNVGIGTAAPVAALDISGGIGGSDILRLYRPESGSETEFLFSGNGCFATIAATVQTNCGIAMLANGTAGLTPPDYVAPFFLKDNDRVGIGCKYDDVTADLDISGTFRPRGTVLDSTGAGAGVTAGWVLKSDGTGKVIWAVNSASSYLQTCGPVGPDPGGQGLVYNGGYFGLGAGRASGISSPNCPIEALDISGNIYCHGNGSTAPWTGGRLFMTQGNNNIAIVGTAPNEPAPSGAATGLGQGERSIAIGWRTAAQAGGSGPQGDSAIAIGPDAADHGQGDYAIALGYAAGCSDQSGNSVAIGSLAAQSTQDISAVAVGFQAGRYSQQKGCIAIGSEAGRTNQGSVAGVVPSFSDQNAIAIGTNAGWKDQEELAIAIGMSAGESGTGAAGQGGYCIAIGNRAGRTDQGNDPAGYKSAIAIGRQAGMDTQGYESVAIGRGAGETNQNYRSIAIGRQAGLTGQGYQSVAIGTDAGMTNQGNYSVALGLAAASGQGDYSVAIGDAGGTNQGQQCIAIGYLTGATNQGAQSIAMGNGAANASQGGYSIAVGYSAGNASQGDFGVAIGYQAGAVAQGANSVAVGYNSGGAYTTTRGASCVAVGHLAGAVGGGDFSIAVGFNAGAWNQDGSGVAIGDHAGYYIQGLNSVAIGANAAGALAAAQGASSVAIGHQAGFTTQGENCVAIGHNTGYTSQSGNSIAIGQGAGFLNQGAGGGSAIGSIAIGYEAAGEATVGQAYGAIAIGYKAGRGQTAGAGYPTAAQGAGAIAIGNSACSFCQDSSGNIAIGSNAAQRGQKDDSIAIGHFAGYEQNEYCVAIGYKAGSDPTTALVFQGIGSVAIGHRAAGCIGFPAAAYKEYSVSIGYYAAATSMGEYAVAIGYSSGKDQGDYAISIGSQAGESRQGINSIAIGRSAGKAVAPAPAGLGPGAIAIGYAANSQPQTSADGTIAIGSNAAGGGQSESAIAIGYNAGTGGVQGQGAVAIGLNAGYGGQHANTIAINANGSIPLATARIDSCYIDPIDSVGQEGQVLLWNTTTKEVFYHNPTFVQDAAGEVGINVAVPDQILCVEGITGVDTNIKVQKGGMTCLFGCNSTNPWIWTANEIYIQFGTDNKERMRIAANGYIGMYAQDPGVGHAGSGWPAPTPAYQLEVRGTYTVYPKCPSAVLHEGSVKVMCDNTTFIGGRIEGYLDSYAYPSYTLWSENAPGGGGTPGGGSYGALLLSSSAGAISPPGAALRGGEYSFVTYNFGIGSAFQTVAPSTPLTIVGAGTSQGYTYYVNSGGFAAAAGTNVMSILAERGIMTSQAFYGASDSRIKKNIVEVPDGEALQQVRDIECKHYDYKDILRTGERTIGFIAQQVKEILPMAVTLREECIPNEMRMANDVSWNVVNDASGNASYKLTINDLDDSSGNTLYRFYLCNDPSGNDEVRRDTYSLEEDPKSFILDASYNQIYIYGKQVDDFHALDKQKIFTLHHSAIQELDKLLTAEKAKTAALETKLASFEARLAALESQ